MVFPPSKQLGFVAAVINPGNWQLAEQEADLAELMTALAATYYNPNTEKLVFVDQKRGVKCCVRSSTYEQCYLVVIDALDDGTATVTFIDFDFG